MKTAVNQDEVRRSNDVQVLESLMHGPLTRRELQSITSLSWGGITNTINRLMEAGYIVEHRSINRRCGRTPALAALTEEDNYVLGVDVNHTGLTGCVTALTGKIISSHTMHADFSSPDALMNCIESFIFSILRPLNGRHIMALGISMQGEVDIHTGISLRLPQCTGWENMPIRDHLSRKLGMNVYIAHDPDCMLHAYMADTGTRSAVLMRLDNSVGMAASVEGVLIQGPGLMEAAHMILDPAGPECICGMRGCLNAYVSAAGDTGNYTALAKPLAMTAHNLIQLFRPEKLVFAGELMEQADLFMPLFQREFAGISCHFNRIDIQTVSDAQLAMRGAALIAAEQAVKALDIREKT